MEYKLKMFGTKQQSADGALALCNDCGHQKDAHYVLETLVVTSLYVVYHVFSGIRPVSGKRLSPSWPENLTLYFHTYVSELLLIVS